MNVLALDDDPTNLALLAHMVAPVPGISLAEYSDPADALQWCSTNKPDLLLIDYMMPKMDGLQFLKFFRRLPGCALVPVIMLTAAGDASLRNTALLSSVTDFMTKPVNGVELRARVANMLAWRREQLLLIAQAAFLEQEVAQASAAKLARDMESVRCLSQAARSKDPETGEHLLRMSTYSHLLAGALGLSVDEQIIVRDAAPLHDIGKVGIPDSILLKPGSLTAQEMTVMQTHPSIGAAILCAGTSPLLRAAATIALGHHEKYDGSGYPNYVSGEAIPLYARIVAVADVFDALTSVRPYKEAWPIERAAQHMRGGAHSHFDPRCIDAFLGNLDRVREIHRMHQDAPCAG